MRSRRRSGPVAISRQSLRGHYSARAGMMIGMQSGTLVSVEEYLNTSYSPDCEYVEGKILERNLGEFDHSRLQTLLTGYLLNREKEWGILAVTEQRVQVKRDRFRVPDICVLAGGLPSEQ